MPNSTIRLPFAERKRRLALAKGVLDIHQALHDFHDSPAIVLTLLAAAIGWYSGKLHDISTIANLTHLSRTAVMKHIMVMEKAGVVRVMRTRKWVYVLPLEHTAGLSTDLYRNLELIFTRTGRNA